MLSLITGKCDIIWLDDIDKSTLLAHVLDNQVCGLKLPREPYRSTRLLQLTSSKGYNTEY